MTLFILICSLMSIIAISALIFDFGIDEDLREAMNYEATMDATAKAIKGKTNG